MTDDDRNREQVLRVIEGVQPSLARFARESYEADGRGLILVKLPPLPSRPGTTRVATEMVYHRLDDLRRLFSDVSESSREDADITLRMVETYHPERQAVVTAALGSGNPITIKMRLEPPAFVDGPDTVQ